MDRSAHEITVVVYGIRKRNTRLCYDNVRAMLSSAQTIFSMWKGSQANDLSFDKPILGEESKTFYFTHPRNKNIDIWSDEIYCRLFQLHIGIE